MVPHIRPAQLADWLRQCRAQTPDAEPIVLDVREPWEVQTASVRPDGFELRHMPMASIPMRLSELPPPAPVAPTSAGQSPVGCWRWWRLAPRKAFARPARRHGCPAASCGTAR